LPTLIILTGPLILSMVYLLSMFLALMLVHKNNLIHQIIKFIQVGSLNTFVDWGTLNVFLMVATVSSGFLYPLCKAASFVVAATNSYFWNKYWTFRKEEIRQRTPSIFNRQLDRIRPQRGNGKLYRQPLGASIPYWPEIMGHSGSSGRNSGRTCLQFPWLSILCV